MQLLFSHYLQELRFRSLYVIGSCLCSFCVGYVYSQPLLFLCIKPFLLLESFRDFMYTDLTEGLQVALHISIVLAVWITVPFALYSMCAFLLKTLYEEERILFIRYLLFFVWCVVIAFGTVWLYLPVFWQFFLQFEISQGFFQVHFQPKLVSYVSLLVSILFSLQWITCLIPCYFLLIQKRWISPGWCDRTSFLCLTILLASAIAPPDIGIQFVCTLFLFFTGEILYFIAILLQEYTRTEPKGNVE